MTFVQSDCYSISTSWGEHNRNRPHVPVLRVLKEICQPPAIWQAIKRRFSHWLRSVYVGARSTVWVKKSLLRFSDIFFRNDWEFLVQILHAYYTFLSTLDYRSLFNYLQLWRNYAILSATTQSAFRPMVDILSTWCELGVTSNRRVKFGLKIPNRLGKCQKTSGVIFWTHCRLYE